MSIITLITSHFSPATVISSPILGARVSEMVLVLPFLLSFTSCILRICYYPSGSLLPLAPAPYCTYAGADYAPGGRESTGDAPEASMITISQDRRLR